MIWTVRSSIRLLLATTALLAATACPSQAQDERIRTTTTLSKAGVTQIVKAETVDAEGIVGMLNEGLFALECAVPTKMRAVVMFITEDDVISVDSQAMEMKPGEHSAQDVMPGENVSDAWHEVTANTTYGPEPARTLILNEPQTSTDEMVDAMRDEMEISDGRIGLVMFLTQASSENPGMWGDRGLQIIPLGIAFSPTD
ncbi:hypothetical protein [Longibacter sp.]|uniref:hypothetical protein n=1 Tax=Longibacter sp. TaxID=2045415 RepID=UPI003EB89345